MVVHVKGMEHFSVILFYYAVSCFFTIVSHCSFCPIKISVSVVFAIIAISVAFIKMCLRDIYIYFFCIII